MLTTPSATSKKVVLLLGPSSSQPAKADELIRRYTQANVQLTVIHSGIHEAISPGDVTLINGKNLPDCQRKFSCWEKSTGLCCLGNGPLANALQQIAAADEVVVPLDLLGEQGQEADPSGLSAYSCADVQFMLKTFELCLSALTWQTIIGQSGAPVHPLAKQEISSTNKRLSVILDNQQKTSPRLVTAQLEWIKTVYHFKHLHFETNGTSLTSPRPEPDIQTANLLPNPKIIVITGSSRKNSSISSGLARWFLKGLGYKENIEVLAWNNGTDINQVSQQLDKADLIVLASPNSLGGLPRKLLAVLSQVKLPTNKPRQMVLLAAAGFPHTTAKLFGNNVKAGLFALMEEEVKAFCQKHNIRLADSLTMPLSELQSRIGLGKKFRAYLAGWLFARHGKLSARFMGLFNWPKKLPLAMANLITGLYFYSRKLCSILGKRNGCQSSNN